MANASRYERAGVLLLEPIPTFRECAEKLGLSCLLMDELTGLPAGYTGKVLGPRRIKSLGAISTDTINGALGVKLAVIEDPDAMKRMEPRWERRNEAHVRTGNISAAGKK